MTAKELILPRVVATFTGTIATVTTTNLTADLKLAPGATYSPNDRLVLVIRATTAGTTDSSSFDVQDAPDNAGSIGTPAAAVLDRALVAATTGSQTVVYGVRLQNNRPWIRVRVIRGAGTTDTLLVSAVLLAVPHNI